MSLHGQSNVINVSANCTATCGRLSVWRSRRWVHHSLCTFPLWHGAVFAARRKRWSTSHYFVLTSGLQTSIPELSQKTILTIPMWMWISKSKSCFYTIIFVKVFHAGKNSIDKHQNQHQKTPAGLAFSMLLPSNCTWLKLFSTFRPKYCEFHLCYQLSVHHLMLQAPLNRHSQSYCVFFS